MAEKQEVALDVSVFFAISYESAIAESITSPKRRFRKQVVLAEEESIEGIFDTDRAHLIEEIQKIANLLKEKGYEELATDPPS